MISFVAALQNTSFNRIGPCEFNSAMTTGNLGSQQPGWFFLIVDRETMENRSKAITPGLICLSFLEARFAEEPTPFVPGPPSRRLPERRCNFGSWITYSSKACDSPKPFGRNSAGRNSFEQGRLGIVLLLDGPYTK
jgi:hypothetical protein